MRNLIGILPENCVLKSLLGFSEISFIADSKGGRLRQCVRRSIGRGQAAQVERASAILSNLSADPSFVVRKAGKCGTARIGLGPCCPSGPRDIWEAFLL
jgi:hypothetical protein